MDVDFFEKITAQMDGLYQEMALLAKKSPNDAVNAFKIKLINSTLVQANQFLGEGYRPFKDFDCFATDDLPTNSDVAVIVSQYIECAEKLRADNVYNDMGKWYWRVSDGRKIRTSQPKKITKK